MAGDRPRPNSLQALARHARRPSHTTSPALDHSARKLPPTPARSSHEARRLPATAQGLERLAFLKRRLRDQEHLASPLDLVHELFHNKPPKKRPLYEEALQKASTSRHALEDVFSTALRHIIIAQLANCNDIPSILRVAWTCIGRPSPEFGIGILCDYFLLNFDRLSNRAYTDVDLLAALHTIRHRLADVDAEPPQSLPPLGLILAARCHNYPSIKLYMSQCEEQGIQISSSHFGKILLALRTPGAGKSLTQDEIDIVLFGPPGVSVERLQSHLARFLNRSDFTMLRLWLDHLTTIRRPENLWDEWQRWLENPLRSQLPQHTPSLPPSTTQPPAHSEPTNPLHVARPISPLQRKGDFIFLTSFVRLSSHDKAWAVLTRSTIPASHLRHGVLKPLLAHSQHAPEEFWTDRMRDLLKEVYEDGLAAIERRLGVRWVWDEEAGMGWHVIVRGRAGVAPIFEDASKRLAPRGEVVEAEAEAGEVDAQFFTPVEERVEKEKGEREREREMIGTSGDSWLDDYM